MTKGRRALGFADLRDVIADVEHLRGGGYRTLGRWTLAQICNHLGNSIDYTSAGFPGRAAPWLVQQSIGRGIRWLMLSTGRIAEGVQLPAEYRPRADLDESAEAARLKDSIGRFEAFDGALAAHPLVGRMSKMQWQRYHCIHCAHHLSFVLPSAQPV